MTLTNFVHGWSGYCRHGCRCEICDRAARTYRASRRLLGERPSNALGVPDWMDNAACRGEDTVTFFGPELIGSGSNGRPWDTRPAKAICAACPVREDCLSFAIAEGIRYGVWGGMSPKQRQKLSAEVPRSPKVYRCGTTTAYARGCRCDACRQANTLHQAEFRARTSTGVSKARRRCPECQGFIARDDRCRRCGYGQETA